jgi:hypothetical protein
MLGQRGRLPPAVTATVLTCLAGATCAHARTFADSLTTRFEQPLATALASQIARSIPVPAASSGLTFDYDPETGAFARRTSVLGQLYLERPETVGRGRVNVSLTYQHVRIDTVDGEDIRDLSDVTPIRDPRSAEGFVIPHFGLDIETHEAIASVTYGVTDDLEANLAIPVLYGTFALDARFRDVSTGIAQDDPVRGAKLGVGDLLLRAKYRLLSADALHVALGLGLSLPTGSEDDFQGTGTVEVAPFVYLSRAAIPLGTVVRLQPFLQGGVTLDADDVGRSEPRWGVGVDVGIGERATLGLAVLGRHALARIGPPGFTDAPRTDGSTQPLFGIAPGRPDFYDFSIGGRIAVWHDTVIAFANVLVPLNDDGFRADAIPLVGVEAAF